MKLYRTSPPILSLLLVLVILSAPVLADSQNSIQNGNCPSCGQNNGQLGYQDGSNSHVSGNCPYGNCDQSNMNRDQSNNYNYNDNRNNYNDNQNCPDGNCGNCPNCRNNNYNFNDNRNNNNYNDNQNCPDGNCGNCPNCRNNNVNRDQNNNNNNNFPTNNNNNIINRDQNNGQFTSENVMLDRNTYGVGADGHKLVLNNNPNAKEPTYAELVDFLQKDKTDEIPYSDSFQCGDFAERTHNNMEAAGIKAAFAASDNCDHAINAVQTSDRGLVYVDTTGQPGGATNQDKIVKMEDGRGMVGTKISGDGSETTMSCSPSDLKIQW
jgi:hypothetical protein